MSFNQLLLFTISSQMIYTTVTSNQIGSTQNAHDMSSMEAILDRDSAGLLHNHSKVYDIHLTLSPGSCGQAFIKADSDCQEVGLKTLAEKEGDTLCRAIFHRFVCVLRVICKCDYNFTHYYETQKRLEIISVLPSCNRSFRNYMFEDWCHPEMAYLYRVQIFVITMDVVLGVALFVGLVYIFYWLFQRLEAEEAGHSELKNSGIQGKTTEEFVQEVQVLVENQI